MNHTAAGPRLIPMCVYVHTYLPLTTHLPQLIEKSHSVPLVGVGLKSNNSEQINPPTTIFYPQTSPRRVSYLLTIQL